MAESNKDSEYDRPSFGKDPEGQFTCTKCTMRFNVLSGVAALPKFSGIPKTASNDTARPKNDHICPDCNLRFYENAQSAKSPGIKVSIDFETYVRQGGSLYKQGTCEICLIPLFGATRVPRKRCGEHKIDRPSRF